MAFNPPLVDDFNRASLGANYTNLAGTATITANQLASSVAPSVTVYTPENWVDAWAAMPITTLPAVGTSTDLGVRVQNIGSIATLTGYAVRFTRSAGTDTLSLVRIDAPVTAVVLQTSNQEMGAGDWIGIRIYGTELSSWYKTGSNPFTFVGSFTDATYSGAGDVSFTLPDTTIRVDQWNGGAYVPQPPQFRRPVMGRVFNGRQ